VLTVKLTDPLVVPELKVTDELPLVVGAQVGANCTPAELVSVQARATVPAYPFAAATDTEAVADPPGLEIVVGAVGPVRAYADSFTVTVAVLVPAA
jgi:hypothetical protein